MELQVVSNSAPLEEFFHHPDPHYQVDNMFGAHQNLNGAVFSAQESEFTSNMSASRKRNRQQDDYQFCIPEQMFHLHQHQHPSQFSQQILPSKMAKLGQVSAKSFTPSTSTSGQSSLVSSFLPSTQDLDSYLLIQNLEIEALIQQQNEKLRSELQETRKMHCRSLTSLLEHQFQKKLQEKERKLANVNSRNADLEEKLKQLSAENQILFNVAKNNEDMASSLKSSLEQIILFNQNQNQIKEGFGDSDEDAQSFCKTIGEKERRSCKVCHENDISVIVLPCRHLCLCKPCEFKNDSCPICNSPKSATLEVFIF